jgi:microcin C transport system substrate-binding protein
VDLKLQLLEPGAAFQRMLERKFEMAFVAMGAAFYPDPRQYLHSFFKAENNNNNFWGFGTPEVDELIATYEGSLDADARMKAMHGIDRIVHDEAFYIPFYDIKFMRLVHWDYLQFPDFHLPKRADADIDWLVYWIDPAGKAALEEAMRDGRALPVDPEIDKDFHGVRKKLQ